MTFYCSISDHHLLSNNSSSPKDSNSRCLLSRISSSSSSSSSDLSNNSSNNSRLLPKKMTLFLNLTRSWQEWPPIQLLSSNSNSKCQTSLQPTRCLWTTLIHSPPICQIWIWTWAWVVWTICRCLIWIWEIHLLQTSQWTWTWTRAAWVVSTHPIINLVVQALSKLLNSLSNLVSLLLLLMADLAQTHGLRTDLMCSATPLRSAMIVKTIRFKNLKIFSLWLMLRLRPRHNKNLLSIWLITLPLHQLNKLSNSSLLSCNNSSSNHPNNNSNLCNNNRTNKTTMFLPCQANHHLLSNKNNLRLKTMLLTTCLVTLPLNLSSSNRNRPLICLLCLPNNSNSSSSQLTTHLTSVVIHPNLNNSSSRITVSNSSKITMVRSNRTCSICLLDDNSFLH